VVLVDSVVGAAALPEGAEPPTVAKTPPEGEPAPGLGLAEEEAALALVALAAEVVPAAAPPVSPAVAVGSEPAPWVCPLGTQSLPEIDEKAGLAPWRSFSTLSPGSGYKGSELGEDLQELISARLPTKSSGYEAALGTRETPAVSRFALGAVTEMGAQFM
jgi:hypothetical protein